MFSTYFTLYKWYHFALGVTYVYLCPYVFCLGVWYYWMLKVKFSFNAHWFICRWYGKNLHSIYGTIYFQISSNLAMTSKLLLISVKGTLRQIWKSPYMSVFIQNNTLKISHSSSYKFSNYLPVKFVNFLKSRPIFNMFYVLLLLNVGKQTFDKSHVRMNISKSKRCFNLKSSTYYFHVKKKILADFQICISVPLSNIS